METAGRTVLLLGATGLVGRECLRQLDADPTVAGIVVLARRPMDAVPAKAKLVITGFDKLRERPQIFAVDHILCALGTTIRQAGSQQAFRRVDFGYAYRSVTIAQAGAGGRRGARARAVGARGSAGVAHSRIRRDPCSTK